MRIASLIIPILLITHIADVGADACTLHQVEIKKLQASIAWLDTETNYLDGFIVQHCGERLVEAYFHKFDRDTLHDIQSATKTFTGFLIGIALDQGIVKSIDQPIIELLPEYSGLLTGDKAGITVRHLLTMTSGLRWVDFGDDRSFGRMAKAPDSIAFILGEPLESIPGEVWFYNTGSSHLLSGIIQHSSGMTTEKFAREYLFGPLGFGEIEWRTHPDGVNEGGWQLHLTPNDMANFGQMLLDHGMWKGKRIVSSEFVDSATQYLNPTPFGDSGYGYQMWIETGFGAGDVAGARGWGGQDIFVLEDLHMVIVFTGSINHPVEMQKAAKKIVSEFVIPAHN